MELDWGRERGRELQGGERKGRREGRKRRERVSIKIFAKPAVALWTAES